MSQNNKIKPGRGAISQTKEVICNIYRYFLYETESKTESMKRVVTATKIGERSVYRYLKQANFIELGPSDRMFYSERKFISHNKWVTHVDEFTLSAIRHNIYNSHITNGFTTSLRALNDKLKKDGVFEGSCESLGTILRKIGFQWKKTTNNGKILCETMKLKNLRLAYLRSIQEYRSTGKYIVYLDETYVSTSNITMGCSSGNSVDSARKPIGNAERFIIAHAGGENGFIEDGLLLLKSNSKSGDYKDVINGHNFRWWLTSIIPNLPHSSVIVMDNASYHNVKEEKAPTNAWNKQNIKNWLTEKEIEYTEEMLKSELLDIANRNKNRFEIYSIDKLLKQHDHEVLRLPPYHPELNPIEKIWEIVKNNIAKENSDDVESLLREEFENIPEDVWQASCESSKNYEQIYFENELKFDEADLTFIVDLEESSEETDSDDSE